jgi:hypothetical protein
MIKRLRARGDYALWVYSAQTALLAMGYAAIKTNEHNDIFAENADGDYVRMALSETPNGRVAFMFDADEAGFAERFKTHGNHSYWQNLATLKKAQDRETPAPKRAPASGIFERSAEGSQRKSIPPASARAPVSNRSERKAAADRGASAAPEPSAQPSRQRGLPKRPPVAPAEEPAPRGAGAPYRDPFGDAEGSTLPLAKLDALYEAFRKEDEEAGDGAESFEAFDPFAFVDNPRFYFYLGRLARKIVVGIILFVFGYFLGNL